MEQDIIDLVERLLVEVASMMEDVSAEILLQDPATLKTRVSAAAQAGETIRALAQAAVALIEVEND